ncbi:MAG TPA: Uma2 family endonuclease [Tepidisphaeraceae bacterium]|jgi:Uma2 family endonuclease|nr:Uma2 family endonuclease [Tepidisphaeraceae bacterium]
MSRVVSKPRPVVPPVLPLEPGDHLTRDEFERRYDATPGLKKAELIEGVVYMPPPAVRWDFHGGPQFELIYWLGVYRAATPGVLGGDNSSVRMDLKNEPQPDAFLFVDPQCGGAARINEGYIEGAPELVAEVSSSTVSIDLNSKFRVYRRNAVQEYLVWRVRDRAIDWFALGDGDYSRLPVDSDGIIRSRVFPGLWLPPESMLATDSPAVIRAIQQGIESPEHAEFVAKLQSSRSGA